VDMRTEMGDPGALRRRFAGRVLGLV